MVAATLRVLSTVAEDTSDSIEQVESEILDYLKVETASLSAIREALKTRSGRSSDEVLEAVLNLIDLGYLTIGTDLKLSRV